MTMFKVVVFAVMSSFLAACSTSHSTIRNEGLGYAISRTQAKEIVTSSVLAHFAPDYIIAGPENGLTSSGYIRFIADTHTINATALPVRGFLATGEATEGFGFEVNAFGSMPMSGAAKAQAVYDLVKQQAAGMGEVISIKKPSQPDR